jgi:hypothetical protein
MLKSGKNFNISTGTIQEVHQKILLIQENKKLLFKQGQLHDTTEYPEVWRKGIRSTYINTFFHRCVKYHSNQMSLNDKKYLAVSIFKRNNTNSGLMPTLIVLDNDAVREFHDMTG